MDTKGNKKAIILISSDPLFDQRAQKVKNSLAQMGYDVQIWGVQRYDELSNSNDFRWRFRWKSGPLFYLSLGIRIIRELKKQSPALVWACDPDTLWAASWVKKTDSFFLTYDSHELFSEVPELIGKPFKKRIWDFLEKQGAKKIDLGITVSKPIAEILQNKLSNPFHLLMNMPISTLEIEPLEKKNVILYQGAINQGRRIKELIEAIENLPEWEVWIAGKGDLEEKLKKWSTALPFSQRVKWLGMLSKNQLSEITKQAKIGYNGLDWKYSKSYEFSLANKFFDYVQAEVPVITASTTTYQNLLAEFSVGWPEDIPLSELLNNILGSSEEYKKKVEACKFAKQKWTWENQWENIKLWIP